VSFRLEDEHGSALTPAPREGQLGSPAWHWADFYGIPDHVRDNLGLARPPGEPPD
jgi:hypothetical protein